MDEDHLQLSRTGLSRTSAPSLGSARWCSWWSRCSWRCWRSYSSEAWPSFAHNGLGWFGPGGSVDQQIQAIFTSGELKEAPVYTVHAWPLIWSTILITLGAVVIAFVCLAVHRGVHGRVRAGVAASAMLEPVVRLLASVPSVIYGLVGVLVLVPFIGNHLITQSEKASVTPVIQLSGYSLLAAVVILTVMIAPIMIAMFADGFAGGPPRMAGRIARSRGQPVANVLEDRRPDGPARARRRHRAGDRPRAGRGRDAQHGLGLGRLRARIRSTG